MGKYDILNRFVENFQDSENSVRQICNKNASQLLPPLKLLIFSISMVKLLRKDIKFGERIYTPEEVELGLETLAS